MPRILALFLLPGCGTDAGLKVYNEAPEVTFTWPSPGAILHEGQPVTLTALVSDNQQNNEGLTYTWTSTLDGTLTGEQTITDAGVVLIPEVLSAGEQTVLLQVTDERGETGSANSTFSIVANEPPLVSFLSPSAGARFAAGAQIHVAIEVTDDREADLSTIVLAWDGLADTSQFPVNPSTDGTGDFYTSLPDLGTYSLSVTATDPLGETTEDTVSFEISEPDIDGDGYMDVELGGDDCNDGDAAIHPGATERCDGVDNDCDGTADNSDAVGSKTWYPDTDADGFGDAASPQDACDQPPGYLSDGTDCDDANARIYPGATEVCDDADNDCDGTIDENDAADVVTWYSDSDGDGWGDDDTTYVSCDAPVGFVAGGNDCNDSNASVSPGATEYCNGRDDNCDGTTDEDTAADATTWYRDADYDSYGDVSVTDVECSQPSGYVADATDCDDTDSGVSPSDYEYCDGEDDDCDGTIDDSPVDSPTWYEDADGDTLGNPASTARACTQPASYVANASDCDDTDAAVLSASSMTWYRDYDADSYGYTYSTTSGCTAPAGYVGNDDDCNDYASTVYPGAADTWYDGVDSDCAGDSDYDADLDGFTSDDYGGTDCDDTDATRYPGSATWTVPGDATSIQGAIDIACTLDRIEVSAGTYVENVKFGAKDVDLVAVDGATLTTIDGDFNGDPAVTMSGGRLEGFTITGALASNGGGVYVYSADSVELVDLVVTENLATTYGGGIYLSSVSNAEVTGCLIEGNTAGYYGGGLAHTSSYGSGPNGLIMSDTEITGNAISSGGYGGGMYASTGYTSSFTDVTIYGNSSSSSYAGAAYISGTWSWTGGSIEGNSGGGLYANGNITMSDTVIADNSNYYPVRIEGYGTIENVQILDNYGYYPLYVYGYGLTLRDVVVDGNYGDSYSSGYFYSYSAGVNLENVTFTDNQGNSSGSTSVYFNGETGTWENVVIAGNTGTGLYLSPSSTSAKLYVTNATVVGNSGTGIYASPTWVKQIYLTNVISAYNGSYGVYDSSSTFDPIIEYSDVYGNGATAYSGMTDPTGSDGNLAVDPEFVAYADDARVSSWDLHLDASSPLIDEGDPTLADSDGTASDIGAYGGEGGDAEYADDADGDGMYDGWEDAHGLDSTVDDSAFDYDGDGLTNAEEFDYGTDPEDENTDQDKTNDGDEVAAGDDPLATDDAWDFQLNGASSPYAYLVGYSLGGGGDFNNDGKDDLVVSSYYQNWVVNGPVSSTGYVGSVYDSLVNNYNYYQGDTAPAFGDYNGDGYDDMVTRYYYDSTSGSYCGAALVWNGPFASSESTPDATRYGEAGYDYAGSSLARAGDLNADGKDDLLVGAQEEDAGGTSSGAVYLITGSISGTSGLSGATAKIVGESTYDYLGYAVAGAGDADGDGTDDFMASAYQAGTSSEGKIYVFSGLVSGTVGAASADYILSGTSGTYYAGYSIGAYGDNDGDGYDDVFVSNYYERNYAGAAWIVNGPLTGDMTLSSADGKVTGNSTYSYMGRMVRSAGDLNSDGHGDMILGGYGDDSNGSESGAAWIVMGPVSGSTSVSDAEIEMLGQDDSHYLGYSVASGVDVDDDGVGDAFVGAYGANGSYGAVYVILGGW